MSDIIILYLMTITLKQMNSINIFKFIIILIKHDLESYLFSLHIRTLKMFLRVSIQLMNFISLIR